MAHVFADAGYRISKGIEDGVLSVHFPILPTDTSVGVMERREHRAESASMRRLLHPQRVVVHGAGLCVQELVNSMLRGGFRGEILAVSTDDQQVAGVPTAATLADIDGRVDLALVSVPIRELGGCGDRRRPSRCPRHGRAHRHRFQGRRQPDDHQPGSRVRGACARTGCARSDQHRQGDRAQRDSGADAATRRRRAVLPIGCGRGRPAEPCRPPGPRAVVVHQHRRLRRCDRQRRDAVLGGRRGHPGLPAVAGLDRQPAEVLPNHPPAGPAQTRRGVRSRAGPTARRTAAPGAWPTPPTRRWTRSSARPG